MKRIYTSIIIATLAALAIGCGGGLKLNDLSPRELYLYGQERYEKKKYLKAIELFQSVIYNYPGEAMVDSAQYYLGLSYFGNKDYELSAVEFNRLVVNYPASNYFEDAMYMKAVAYYQGTPKHYALDQSDLDRAIKLFNDYLIDFPESKRIPEVKQKLKEAHLRLARKYYGAAQVYNRIGGYRASKIYCQKVIDDYTDTEYAGEAIFLFGEVELKLRKYDLAREKFESFVSIFPDHQKVEKAKEKLIEAAFKAAVHAFDKGKFDDARTRFEKFNSDFPESNKKNKADKYLRKIADISNISSQAQNGNS